MWGNQGAPDGGAGGANPEVALALNELGLADLDLDPEDYDQAEQLMLMAMQYGQAAHDTWAELYADLDFSSATALDNLSVEDCESLLYAACEANTLTEDIVLRLVEKGISFDSQDAQPAISALVLTHIDQACSEEELIEKLEWLLPHGAIVEFQALQDCLEEVLWTTALMLLLEHGPFDQGIHTSVDGDNLLLAAVRAEHDEAVTWLLEQGFDLSLVPYDEDTLMTFCTTAHVACLAKLLEVDAVNLTPDAFNPMSVVIQDCNAEDDDPVDDDERSRRLECLNMLLEAKANINYQSPGHMNLDDDSWSPLAVASRLGDMKLVSWLVEHEALVNQISNQNNYEGEVISLTPLACAAQEGHVEVVQYLLDKGAKTEYLKANGNHATSALCFAAQCNERDSVQVLLDAGADIAWVDEDGTPPLHDVVKCASSMAVKSLLDLGGDVYCVDAKSNNLLYSHLYHYSRDTAQGNGVAPCTLGGMDESKKHTALMEPTAVLTAQILVGHGLDPHALVNGKPLIGPDDTPTGCPDCYAYIYGVLHNGDSDSGDSESDDGEEQE